jgi:hypothetical protein
LCQDKEYRLARQWVEGAVQAVDPRSPAHAPQLKQWKGLPKKRNATIRLGERRTNMAQRSSKMQTTLYTSRVRADGTQLFAAEPSGLMAATDSPVPWEKA